ncbi:hypothetical protein ES705_46044 [subsurface metagenome]
MFGFYSQPAGPVHLMLIHRHKQFFNLQTDLNAIKCAAGELIFRIEFQRFPGCCYQQFKTNLICIIHKDAPLAHDQ